MFELENQRERAAYSLWKVICVRAELRVVFAYRNDWQQVQQLVQSIKSEVIDGYSIEQRQTLDDSTLLITGSRGEGKTTFVRACIAQLSREGRSVGGILSPAVFDNEQRIGYDLIDLCCGARRELARVSRTRETGPTVGMFQLDEAAIEEGIAAIVSAVRDGLDVIAIDDSGVFLDLYFYAAEDTPGEARGLKVSGDYAYVASDTAGLRVIDVSSPNSPQLLPGWGDTEDSARSVTVSGTWAFVADGYEGLQVFDLGDPENPTHVGTVDTPYFAYSVALSGGYAFVATPYAASGVSTAPAMGGDAGLLMSMISSPTPQLDK